MTAGESIWNDQEIEEQGRAMFRLGSESICQTGLGIPACILQHCCLDSVKNTAAENNLDRNFGS
jgi:hypothetical protein